MRNSILIIFVLIILGACSQKKDIVSTSKQEESIKDKAQLKIETPNIYEIDSTGILMMPLTIGTTTDDSSFSGSFESRKENFYWNIIFYDSKTSEKHLITNSKVLISNYTDNYGFSSSGANQNSIDMSSSKKYLFYSIRNFDANKNGKIDLSDPEYLFVSDRKGFNLKQLSPEKTHLVNWDYIASSNKIMMNVLNDDNGDKNWDEKDPLITYVYDMNSNLPAKLIFDDRYKDSLKKNFTHNWLK